LIQDPDHIPLQLYVNRNWTPAALGKLSRADALQLL
jgi:hypothetical protein